MRLVIAKFKIVDTRKAGMELPARFRKNVTAQERQAEELLTVINNTELRQVSELIWSLAGIWAHEYRVIALRKQQQALLNSLGSTSNTPPG